MPRELGTEYTLGQELRLARINDPSARLIVESLVYEADQVRAEGGLIIRVVRPGFVGPAGVMTDLAEASIRADITIVNDGTLDDLYRKVDEVIADDWKLAA